MLIMSVTDAPRLVVAMFAGGDAPFVQILGWITWVAAGALLTLMVSKSHDLAWPKALGASAIQLVAILSAPSKRARIPKRTRIPKRSKYAHKSHIITINSHIVG
jgi:hypothetical protein